MIFTKKCTYGIRALLELVPLNPGETLSIKIIAERTQISRKFLDNVLHQLNHAGILKSKMGSKGGYALCRLPEDIKIYDVLAGLNGPLYLAPCSKNEFLCKKKGNCPVHSLINETQTLVNKFLLTVTLRDLFEKSKSTDNLSFTI
jgi:Rrf2 family protein